MVAYFAQKSEVLINSNCLEYCLKRNLGDFDPDADAMNHMEIFKGFYKGSIPHLPDAGSFPTDNAGLLRNSLIKVEKEYETLLIMLPMP